MADTAPKKAAKPASPAVAKKAKAAMKPVSAKRKVLPKRKYATEDAEGKTLKYTPRKLPAVPQAILDRRKEKRIRIVKKQFARKEAMLFKKLKKRRYFMRAEKYLKKYREMEKDKLRLQRQAKEQGKVVIPEEPKLAFVVRIRGINQVHPKVRKVLKLFRLLQINNGVFMRLNKATINMLRIAEPFVAWGYPNLKTIKQLVYKRGHAKVKGSRVPLYSNTIIEKKLGHLGIICIEDLIHQLYTVGKHFSKVNKFLWAFKLNNPKGGWRMKTRHYVEGGDFGNRENKINSLLAKMI